MFEHMLAAEKSAVDRDQIATSMATFARIDGMASSWTKIREAIKGKSRIGDIGRSTRLCGTTMIRFELRPASCSKLNSTEVG